MDYIASDWIENTGTVPAGVGPDTLVEVEYRDGYVTIWETTFTWVLNNDPNAWELRGDSLEVSRFRFLETPAERDARLLRGIGDLLDAGRVVEQTGYEG